ncbi:BTAD domain-containing putative transcriptional regulator [Nocardia sp. BMG111209]|uniref:BTAD domain-containing putative transcriptional regulator n=1 Tax=Nocardia sp. BMG111209 TaxID=1160137 RepID=UPI0003A1E397|nr:BTAD domain-containing putative transcriptional regulator [Nocardia sp. BMG111209]
MRVSVLGPVRVDDADGTPLVIGGDRVRMLLARLALAGGRPVPPEALIDGLWGEHPPAAAAGALQALVSRLRRALRAAGAVELVAGGYRLAEVEVDADRFEELVRQGRRELAGERAAPAAATFGRALGLWRGPALGDVLDAPFARAAAIRLEELRTAAEEDRLDAELRLGRHAEILPALETAAAARPLSERLAALRIRALAAIGRQADALAAFDEIRARLDDELGIDPSPGLREAHLAVLRGEVRRPAPSPEPIAALPVPLTPFIGRERELREVQRLCATSRLVTVVGPGGAGKTRLALQAATSMPEVRVHFVSLAESGAPDPLADAIAGALAAGSPPDRLLGLLDVGAALLILDNCEHVLDAVAAPAARLLERLPQLTILATSREPLAVTGEALCHLDSLDVPAPDADLPGIAESAAVRLFLDRARAARPDFALDERTAEPVAEICRRLDGLPLALEMAAAKLRSMSVEQISARLDDRFRFLGSGSRAALPRQRTLLALVEWSWDLLTGPERVLAGRLSLFRGGATVEAAQAICVDESLPAADLPYLLDGLVEKSLLPVPSGDPPRYRMSETIRAYAATQFDATGVAAGRFADHFLASACRNEPRLRTREQCTAMAVFDAEHANLEFALRTALDTGDASRAAEFVTALFWYWGLRGMSAGFDTYLTAVLNLPLPDRTRAALRVVHSMTSGLAETAPAADAIRALLGDCLRTGATEYHPALPLWLPLLAFRVGDTETGERVRIEALAAADPWVRGSAHLSRHLAAVERGSGDRSGARAAVREFDQAGDRWGLGMAWLAVGREHALRGEHDAAVTAFEHAVAAGTELGLEDDTAEAWAALAETRMRTGDLAAAARDLDVADRRAATHGLTRTAALLRLSRAELHRRAGEFDRAEALLTTLAQRPHRLPYPEPIAADLVAGARLAVRVTAGTLAPARELLAAAARGAAARGTAALADHARVLAHLHDLEDAPALAAETLGAAQSIRGVPDSGDPEIRSLATRLADRLGHETFTAHVRRGAELPRADAVRLLTDPTPVPSEH